MTLTIHAKRACLASLPLLLSLTCLTASELARADAISQQHIAETITDHALKNRFPNKLQFETDSGREQAGYINYTFNPDIHREMAKVYLQYKPDYACFVAMDVETGAIINLTSFIKSDEDWDNLVLRSDYPAASVFKMVTAAAGLDLGKVSSNSVIPFNGKSTTLYKSQVLRHKTTKWTRTPTLKESFAKSINAVFGQIGIFKVGATNLSKYATKFGFDTELQSDFILPQSHVGLDFDNKFEVAEAASGYTRDITLSPVHAAQMAAIVANGGKMVTPYMVESVKDGAGNSLYRTEPLQDQSQVISSASAKAMRELMRETTRIGSARGSFKGLNRYKVYDGMEIGGKTGSLTGMSPRGRHDWFVGYAQKDGRKIAYASLIINKEKWYVRSAYVARQFIYHYFKEPDNTIAGVAN